MSAKSALQALSQLPSISVVRKQNEQAELLEHRCVKCEKVVARTAIYDVLATKDRKILDELNLLCSKCRNEKNCIYVEKHCLPSSNLSQSLTPLRTTFLVKKEPKPEMNTNMIFDPVIKDVRSMAKTNNNTRSVIKDVRSMARPTPEKNNNNTRSVIKDVRSMARPTPAKNNVNTRCVQRKQPKLKECRVLVKKPKEELYSCGLCRRTRAKMQFNKRNLREHLKKYHKVPNVQLDDFVQCDSTAKNF